MDVCECMCFCLQSSTVEASAICNEILGILECTDQRLCVVGIILFTSHQILTNIYCQDRNQSTDRQSKINCLLSIWVERLL